MRLLTALTLAAALSTGGVAIAANTMTVGPAAKPAAAKPATAATPAKPTATGDKAAISKACSEQADAKGLKGKARKHFRGKCKTAGKAAA